MSRRLASSPRTRRDGFRRSRVHVHVESLESRRLLAVTIHEFPLPTADSSPDGITTGPDGNLWFVETGANKIGRINPTTHAIAEFPIPTANSRPQEITAGPDRNLWFSEGEDNKIGRINPTTHAIAEFATPTASSQPIGITAGPDGNIWFAESLGPLGVSGDKIGRINPTTHAIAEFTTPTAKSVPHGITAGPDGNLWFTEAGANKIGRINPTTHAIAEFAIPTASSTPNGITAGPDGNLWFAEANGSKIGRINPTTHAIAEFATPTASSTPIGITAGPDGNLWFTEAGANKIGRINPTTHAIAEFTTPTAKSAPLGITAGPDGNLWFTEQTGNKIGQLQITTGQKATTTQLASSLNPSHFGQSVTFTATVKKGNTDGTPTGTVSFKEGTATLGTGTIGANGIATFSTAKLTAGSHTITAVYAGDANFAASTSTPLKQVVAVRPTITTLKSSLNPSTVGQSVTFTANVDAVVYGIGGATDTVTFRVDGVARPPVHITVFDGHGRASFSTSSLTVGVHHVVATYSGGSEYGPSNSNIVTQVVNRVPAAATTTTLASSQNPSIVGQAVTFTATVTPAAGSSGSPTGQVGFVEGTRVLGFGPLVHGQATLTLPGLTVGSHLIRAVYAGDANFVGSASSIVTEVVNPPASGDGPRVVGLLRYGFHAQPTLLVLTFSTPLDAARAEDVSNYRIIAPSGRTIGVASAEYDPATRSVLLASAERLNVHRVYRLVVNGTSPGGLTDTSGRLLDGQGTGVPGSDFVASIDRSTLAGPASSAPISASAVDALADSGELGVVGHRRRPRPDR